MSLISHHSPVTRYRYLQLLPLLMISRSKGGGLPDTLKLAAPASSVRKQALPSPERCKMQT